MLEVKSATKKTELSTALPLSEIDRSIQMAVLSLDQKRVETIIGSFPLLEDPDGSFNKQRYYENADRFILALRQAVWICADENFKTNEKWQIALYILSAFIPEYSDAITAYIKKPEISENYQYFIYNRIPSQIASQFQMMPFNCLAKALVVYRHELHVTKVVSQLCFLMQTFRSMGWGRSIVLDDSPTKALASFKKYLQTISPEITTALAEIPSTTLNPVLAQLIAAFKAGKATDECCLSQGKYLSEILINQITVEPTRMVCEYAGFFRPYKATKVDIEPAEEKSAKSGGILEQIKSFFHL